MQSNFLFFALLLLSISFFSFQISDYQSWAEIDKQSIDEDNVDDDGATVKQIAYDSEIILMNIGELDKVKGQYWLDFFFYMESDDVDFTKEIPELVFMNARDIEISNPHITQNYYEVRVRGHFFTQLDFQDFPYEKHKLTVEVEPKIPYDKTRFVFDNAKTQVDSNLSISPNLKMIGATSKAVTHTYFDGLEFSRMVSTFVVEQEPVGTTLRTVLPVTIIAGISLIIFFIPKNFTPRMILVSPLLLTAVFWHQSGLESLPNLGYMTFFDKLMLMYYALFVNNIISLVIQIRSFEIYQNPERAKKFNRIFMYTTIVIITVGMTLLLIS